MRVHLDHNATTPLRPEAREELLALYDTLGSNPSSVHTSGRRARAALDLARQRVAAALGVAEETIIFTSGGTESNNLALMGAVRTTALRGPRPGLAITSIEHSSVLGAAGALASEGRPVRLIGVDPHGAPEVDTLLAELRDPETAVAVVSTMAANNEVGSLTDLEAVAAGLAALPPKRRPIWHVDAVQALGRVAFDPAALGIDLVSLSAHKVGGPAGVGVLLRKPGTPLTPLLFGGGQEGELRPGTENVAAIGAAAVAIELAVREQPTFHQRAGELLRTLGAGLVAAVDGLRVFGPPIDAPQRLPNTLCVLLPGVDGRTFVARLDLEGLEVSAGSACASGSLEASHVLLALGATQNEARAGLRLSIGRTTSLEDVHTAVDIMRRTMMSVSAKR